MEIAKPPVSDFARRAIDVALFVDESPLNEKPIQPDRGNSEMHGNRVHGVEIGGGENVAGVFRVGSERGDFAVGSGLGANHFLLVPFVVYDLADRGGADHGESYPERSGGGAECVIF